MIDTDFSKLVEWKPDFTDSGQASPDWTKVVLNDEVLFNSLEWTEWKGNPIQLLLCEKCGVEYCANGGYATISRYNDFMFLTNPERDIDDPEEYEFTAPHPLLNKHGLILISRKTWENWKNIVDIPTFESFEVLRNRDVLDAWLLENKGIGGFTSFNALFEYLEKNIIASDDFSPDEIIGKFRMKFERYVKDINKKFVGKIEKINGKVQNIYFDNPFYNTWSSYVMQDNEIFLTISNKFIIKE